MNYAPNTAPIELGAVVFHDGDAKLPHMSMAVLGHRPDGLIETAYIDPQTRDLLAPRVGEVMAYPPAFLHHADKFGVFAIPEGDGCIKLSTDPARCTALRADGRPAERPLRTDPVTYRLPGA